MKFNPIVVAGRRTLEIAAKRWGFIRSERKFRSPDERRQRYLLRTHRASGASVLQAVKLAHEKPRRNPPAAELPLAA